MAGSSSCKAYGSLSVWETCSRTVEDAALSGGRQLVAIGPETRFAVYCGDCAGCEVFLEEAPPARLVATRDTYAVAASPDGESWATISLPASPASDISAVVSCQGWWAILGINPNVVGIFVSRDGVTWTWRDLSLGTCGDFRVCNFICRESTGEWLIAAQGYLRLSTNSTFPVAWMSYQQPWTASNLAVNDTMWVATIQETPTSAKIAWAQSVEGPWTIGSIAIGKQFSAKVATSYGPTFVVAGAMPDAQYVGAYFTFSPGLPLWTSKVQLNGWRGSAYGAAANSGWYLAAGVYYASPDPNDDGEVVLRSVEHSGAAAEWRAVPREGLGGEIGATVVWHDDLERWIVGTYGVGSGVFWCNGANPAACERWSRADLSFRPRSMAYFGLPDRVSRSVTPSRTPSASNSATASRSSSSSATPSPSQSSSATPTSTPSPSPQVSVRTVVLSAPATNTSAYIAFERAPVCRGFLSQLLRDTDCDTDPFSCSDPDYKVSFNGSCPVPLSLIAGLREPYRIVVGTAGTNLDCTKVPPYGVLCFDAQTYNVLLNHDSENACLFDFENVDVLDAIVGQYCRRRLAVVIARNPEPPNNTGLIKTLLGLQFANVTIELASVWV